jgi:hypothetical protein
MAWTMMTSLILLEKWWGQEFTLFPLPNTTDRLLPWGPLSPKAWDYRVHFLVVPVSDKLDWLFVRSKVVLRRHQSYLAESYNHMMVGALVRIASLQAEAIYYVSMGFLTGFGTIVTV